MKTLKFCFLMTILYQVSQALLSNTSFNTLFGSYLEGELWEPNKLTQCKIQDIGKQLPTVSNRFVMTFEMGGGCVMLLHCVINW